MARASTAGATSRPHWPGDSITLSDQAPLGRAVSDPYAVTFTAVVNYVLDDGTEHHSATAERTVMIDAEGRVGGSAPGGGGGGGDDGTATLELQVDVFTIDDVLNCSATASNTGDGLAEDVVLTGTLSGPANDRKVNQAAGLPPDNGIVIELSANLGSDRTDTMMFVFETSVAAANAASSSTSTGISVAPDGTVTRG